MGLQCSIRDFTLMSAAGKVVGEERECVQCLSRERKERRNQKKTEPWRWVWVPRSWDCLFRLCHDGVKIQPWAQIFLLFSELEEHALIYFWKDWVYGSKLLGKGYQCFCQTVSTELKGLLVWARIWVLWGAHYQPWDLKPLSLVYEQLILSFIYFSWNHYSVV